MSIERTGPLSPWKSDFDRRWEADHGRPVPPPVALYDEPSPAPPAGQRITKRDRQLAVEGSGEPRWRTLETLLENPDLLKVPAPAAGHLAYLERLVILSGREKLGKSTWAAHELSVCSRAGMTTLWISYEESLGDIVRRFDDFNADPANTVILDRPTNEEILSCVEATGAKVVVVDSFAAWVGATMGRVPQASEGEEWQKQTLRLKNLAADTGACVIALAHTSKSDVEGGIRGSTGVAAAADLIVRMATPRKSDPDELRRVTFLGRWRVEDLQIKYEGDSFSDNRDEAFDVLGMEPAIYNFVSTAEEAPTTRQIENAVTGNRDRISAAVQALVDMGAIHKTKVGRGYRYEAEPGFTQSHDGERLLGINDELAP